MRWDNEAHVFSFHPLLLEWHCYQKGQENSTVPSNTNRKNAPTTPLSHSLILNDLIFQHGFKLST